MSVSNKQYQAIRKLKNVIPEKERVNVTVFDVSIGGFVMVDGVLYLVEDIYTYTYKDESWNEFKLFAVKTGETAFLEFEEDDVIEYYFSKAPLKRREWPVSPEEIEEMADEEDGDFRFNGKTFYYEDDYKVKFKRESNPDKKEKAYLFEFESDDGDCFTVERWSDNDYEAYYSRRPDKVEVISKG